MDCSFFENGCAAQLSLLLLFEQVSRVHLQTILSGVLLVLFSFIFTEMEVSLTKIKYINGVLADGSRNQ